MPRELLKFREGDCGLKIRKDGKLEVAGIDDAGGMIDKKGMVNPVLLFAAAWARRDQKVFQVLIDNFKESVREGYFGDEAKKDYEKADKVKKEHTKSLENQNIAVREPVLDPNYKPTVSAATMSRDVASGAVTFEQPAGRDS